MCNFTIPFEGSAKALIAKAKKAIENAGGTFTGNTTSGSFKITSPVTIEGKYTISGQNIAIDITKKPFFISCSRIESELKKLLGSSAPAANLTASVSTHSDDILPHINNPSHLSARVSSGKGCITLLGVIEVCYTVSNDEVLVSAILKTPLGEVKLGKAILTPSHSSTTFGGGTDGFKAEVHLRVDFTKAILEICGIACAPIAGCKKGCTSVHL